MPQPTLRTDAGFMLRPWRPDDVSVVVEAYADPAIQQWNLRSMDESEAAAWIGSWERGWHAETDAGWAITAGSGTVVGRVSLRDIRLHEGGAQVSYWVLPDARGHGAAADATATICRWAFTEIGLHRIELAHSVRNAASCRVADKASFTFEGTRRSALLHPDGWHDMHLHARLNVG